MNIIKAGMTSTQTLTMGVILSEQMEDDDFREEFLEMFPEVMDMEIVDTDLQGNDTYMFSIEVTVYYALVIDFLQKFVKWIEE